MRFTRSSPIALIAVSVPGAELAARLATVLPAAEVWVSSSEFVSAAPGARVYAPTLRDHTGEIWERCSAIVFVMASGIAVRSIAPYVESKHTDPAVVVVDDAGRFAISLVAGHEGGANALADDIAEATGALPVVTTGSEAARSIVVGVGSRRGVSTEAVLAAVDEALSAADRVREDVRALATIDLKADEAGIREAARVLGVVLRIVDRGRIRDLQDALREPTFAEEVTGVAAVCVPSALLADSHATLLAPAVTRNGVKVAIAEDDCSSSASAPAPRSI